MLFILFPYILTVALLTPGALLLLVGLVLWTLSGQRERRGLPNWERWAALGRRLFKAGKVCCAIPIGAWLLMFLFILIARLAG